MKLTAVTLACLSTGVCARRDPLAFVYERDLNTVTDVLGTVGKAFKNLDTAVQGYNGNAAPVEDTADAANSALQSGKTKVDGSGELSLADALGLQEPVKALESQGETLVSNLKAKKSQIQSDGQCANVRGFINSINSNSQALISSVVSKVPKDAQSIAESMASGVTQVLNDAKSAFSEQNCQGGSTGGSSYGGGSTYAGGSSGGSSGGASSATYPSPSDGGCPTGTTPPIVTAGAAAVAPAGTLALAAAAFCLDVKSWVGQLWSSMGRM